ncbi:MAG: GLPGLI family protein [Bacteroidota bacterium]
MKYTTFLFLLLLPFVFIAQTQEGSIQYEEIMKLQIELPEEMKQYEHLIPKERITKMDLFFDESTSLYTKSVEVAETEENPFGGNVQTQVMTIGGGESSQIYVDRSKKEVVQSENVMGQQFLITAPLESKDWKVLNEQKNILSYTCIKAELEVDSTTTLTAWFSPNLPLSIGPALYYGLPGAVLEIVIERESSSRTIIARKVELTEVSDKIVLPQKGKKVSKEEFDALVQARVEEMRQNSNGESGRFLFL